MIVFIILENHSGWGDKFSKREMMVACVGSYCYKRVEMVVFWTWPKDEFSSTCIWIRQEAQENETSQE